MRASQEALLWIDSRDSISELIFQKVASTQDLHLPVTLPLVTSDTHRWSALLALLPWHAPDCQRVPGTGLCP